MNDIKTNRSETLVRSVLIALTECGIEYALIGGSASLPGRGRAGYDVDIVVNTRPEDCLTTIASEQIGPLLLMHWHTRYSATAVFYSHHLRASVHIDMLHDPQGSGPLGLHTNMALADATSEDDVSVLNEIDQVIFRAAKDALKNMKKNRSTADNYADYPRTVMTRAGQLAGSRPTSRCAVWLLKGKRSYRLIARAAYRYCYARSRVECGMVWLRQRPGWLVIASPDVKDSIADELRKHVPVHLLERRLWANILDLLLIKPVIVVTDRRPPRILRLLMGRSSHVFDAHDSRNFCHNELMQFMDQVARRRLHDG